MCKVYANMCQKMFKSDKTRWETGKPFESDSDSESDEPVSTFITQDKHI